MSSFEYKGELFNNLKTKKSNEEAKSRLETDVDDHTSQSSGESESNKKSNDWFRSGFAVSLSKEARDHKVLIEQSTFECAAPQNSGSLVENNNAAEDNYPNDKEEAWMRDGIETSMQKQENPDESRDSDTARNQGILRQLSKKIFGTKASKRSVANEAVNIVEEEPNVRSASHNTSNHSILKEFIASHPASIRQVTSVKKSKPKTSVFRFTESEPRRKRNTRKENFTGKTMSVPSSAPTGASDSQKEISLPAILKTSTCNTIDSEDIIDMYI